MHALNVARGKYVYGISPGDFLYDEFVIRDFYQFCEKKHAQICFGDADYYETLPQGKVLVNGVQKSPRSPELFEGSNLFRQKVAFMFGNFIVGPSYFRRTDITRKYLELISQSIKYVEDSTSTLFALADGVPVVYYPRKIVWYEYNSGISTSGNAYWINTLNEEIKTTYRLLSQEHPDDRVIDAAWTSKGAQDKAFGIICRFIKHPIISLIILRQKIKKRHYNCATVQKQKEFQEYLDRLNKE